MLTEDISVCSVMPYFVIMMASYVYPNFEVDWLSLPQDNSSVQSVHLATVQVTCLATAPGGPQSWVQSVDITMYSSRRTRAYIRMQEEPRCIAVE